MTPAKSVIPRVNCKLELRNQPTYQNQNELTTKNTLKMNSLCNAGKICSSKESNASSMM